MASSKPFLEAVKERRSIYTLNKDAPISDDKIVDIVKQAVLHVPSSFNSQSARLVVLLNAEHEKFWEFVRAVLKPMVPEDQWSHTEQRVDSFKAGYGTVCTSLLLLLLLQALVWHMVEAMVRVGRS